MDPLPNSMNTQMNSRFPCAFTAWSRVHDVIPSSLSAIYARLLSISRDPDHKYERQESQGIQNSGYIDHHDKIFRVRRLSSSYQRIKISGSESSCVFREDGPKDRGFSGRLGQQVTHCTLSWKGILHRSTDLVDCRYNRGKYHRNRYHIDSALVRYLSL